jgi:hypothetical protein
MRLLSSGRLIGSVFSSKSGLKFMADISRPFKHQVEKERGDCQLEGILKTTTIGTPIPTSKYTNHSGSFIQSRSAIGYGQIFMNGESDIRKRPAPPFIPLKHFHPNALWISHIDEVGGQCADSEDASGGQNALEKDELRMAMKRPLSSQFEPLGHQRIPQMTKDASLVESFAKYFFLTEIFRGLWVFCENFFKMPFTINYPFEKGHLSPRFRGEHALRRYPNGMQDKQGNATSL